VFLLLKALFYSVYLYLIELLAIFENFCVNIPKKPFNFLKNQTKSLHSNAQLQGYTVINRECNIEDCYCSKNVHWSHFSLQLNIKLYKKLNEAHLLHNVNPS